MCLFLLLQVQGPVLAEQAWLTQISKVRSLSRSDAGKALPVKVQGVVTLVDRFKQVPEWLVLDDGAESVWVQVSIARQSGRWRGDEELLKQLRVGDLLEVEGVSHPGGYAPIVIPVRLIRQGTAPLPESRRVPLERLLSGAEDCQRVEVEGVVQAVETGRPGARRTTLAVHALGQPFQVIAEEWTDVDPSRLVDAVVRVRGVFSPISNFRAEMVALRVRIMGAEDVEVVKPPPQDPFGAAHVQLDRLRPFSPEGVSPHRSVTEGVVTYASPEGFFFVQKGPVGVRVEAPGAVVATGDRVEISGFVDMSRLVASIAGAVIRRVGREALPDPFPTSVSQLLRPQKVIEWERVVETDHDGRLIRLQGRLRMVEKARSSDGLQFHVEADGVQTTAHLGGLGEQQITAMEDWMPGSVLELTGVAEMEFSHSAIPEMPKVNGFRIWLRSPDDLKLLDAPSWWTAERLRLALMLAMAVVIAALGWILALRILLKRRTDRLRHLMAHHRDAELAFESARQERQRLAADLHDGLQQMIAGVSYRLEAAISCYDRDRDESGPHLEATRRALNATKSGLQECLWGLRQVEEGPADFPTLLRHALENSGHWPAGLVRVEVAGEAFDLSRDVMGGLLLLVQEAVGNAHRHGGASQIVVRLTYDSGELVLEVEDNGSGFDPRTAPGTREGHFGITGMRERMNWLGGTFELHSQPGNGAHLRVRLPRKRVAAPPSPPADSPRS